MITVVVADDHGIVREGVRRLIEGEPDLSVCGEAADGREVIAEVERSEPDVVVLDITMPEIGGLETLERLRANGSGSAGGPKVILLSSHDDPAFIHTAVDLGADGYILKNGRAGEILTGIRAVMGGGNYFSPAVARELVARVRAPDQEKKDPFSLLSPREVEVLRLLANDKTAKEVAVELGISTKTAEAHRTSLMRKLEMRKVTELVRYAIRHGLIEP